MAIVAVANIADLVADYTIDPLASPAGFVPTTRAVNATAPIQVNGTTSATLAADITVSAVMSPAGGTAVSTGRTITATTPVKIDGGASADFSANRTLSVIPFTGALDGIVAHNPSGVQGKFLKDDNTWGTSTAAGVTSVTGTLPMVASPTTGDVIVSVNAVAIATAGVAPATGGADGTKFLSATNPVSWQVPGTGSFIKLQGGTPGTTDTGHGHISGVFIAETRLAGGPVTVSSVARGVVEAYNQLQSGNEPNYGFFSRAASSGDTQGIPAVVLQRSRGSLASPTATADTNLLGRFTATGYGSSGWDSSLDAGMFVRADGAATTRQPSITDLIGGDVGNFSQARMTGAGLRLESALATITPAARAKSTLDVLGSVGFKTEVISGATVTFNAGATNCYYLADCTAASKQVVLPTAVGIAGRIYGLTKVDTTTGTAQYTTTGGQTINGGSYAFGLGAQGESMLVQSDGSNWWIINSSKASERSASPADGTTVANTVTETSVAGAYIDVEAKAGGVQWAYFAGKFSTTGTPTLRFRVTNVSGAFIMDSTALTMPNNAANYPYMIRVRTAIRSVTASVGTGRVVEAILHIGSSTGQLTPYSMLSNFGDVITGQPAGTMALYVTWGTASTSNTLTSTAAEGGAVLTSYIL